MYLGSAFDRYSPDRVRWRGPVEQDAGRDPLPHKLQSPGERTVQVVRGRHVLEAVRLYRINVWADHLQQYTAAVCRDNTV